MDELGSVVGVKRFFIGVAALLCGFLALLETRNSRAPQETLPFACFPAAAVQPAEQLSTCAAVAVQGDPAKLATLGRGQVNPRSKRILYYLAEASRQVGSGNP